MDQQFVCENVRPVYFRMGRTFKVMFDGHKLSLALSLGLKFPASL